MQPSHPAPLRRFTELRRAHGPRHARTMLTADTCGHATMSLRLSECRLYQQGDPWMRRAATARHGRSQRRAKVDTGHDYDDDGHHQLRADHISAYVISPAEPRNISQYATGLPHCSSPGVHASTRFHGDHVRKRPWPRVSGDHRHVSNTHDTDPALTCRCSPPGTLASAHLTATTSRKPPLRRE